MFTCSRCLVEKTPDNDSIGYAVDDAGDKTCYECCACVDLDHMRDHGKTTLYLNKATNEVINWPGALRIPLMRSKVGNHNMTGRRIDVWFKVNGDSWHGVQYGNNTDIVRCKRIK